MELYGRTYTGTAGFAFVFNAAEKINETLNVTGTYATIPDFSISGTRAYTRTLVCADEFGEDEYGNDGSVSKDIENLAVGRGNDTGDIEDQDDETFAAHPSLTPIPFTPAGHDEVIAIFQNHGFK